MKKILTLLLMMNGACFLSSTSAQMISFEQEMTGGCPPHDPVALGPGAPVDNAYFLCAYGVEFFQDSLTGSLPIYAFIGNAGREGFHRGGTSTYTSAASGGCTNNKWDDRPTNARDVGCWFISTTSGASSLFVKYHHPCTEASGYILDVDYGEVWHIKAFDAGGMLITDRLLLASTATVPAGLSSVTQLTPSTGDGVPSLWNIVSPGGMVIDHIEFDYVGTGGAGVAFDDFYMCQSVTPPDTGGCCNGPNLIQDGGFSAGNGTFTSSYSQEAVVAPNSVGPGEYRIMSSQQASAVSSQWQATDHSSCPNDQGQYLAVNGRTMGAGSAVVYEENVTIEPDSEYVFCMYYQELPQCAFDVFHPSNISVSFNGATATPTNACDNIGPDCDWEQLSWSIVPNPGSTNLNLQVSLDESGIGDGNDVAFDDFTLRLKETMPTTHSQFNVTSSGSGSTFNLTATAVTGPLPPGYHVVWTVEEVDCTTYNTIPGTVMSDTSWDEYSTNFPGYCCTLGVTSPPGTFDINKCYRINRTVTNCCSKDSEWNWWFNNNPLRMAPGGKETQQFQMSTDRENWQVVPQSDPTGIHDGVGQRTFQVYPNPGDGNVTLTSDRSWAQAEIAIYDTEGKEVSHATFLQNQNTVQLDFSSLPEGLYLIQVRERDGTLVQHKYVKQ